MEPFLKGSVRCKAMSPVGYLNKNKLAISIFSGFTPHQMLKGRPSLVYKISPWAALRFNIQPIP